MKPASVEARIAGFVAKYTPEMAATIVACRSRLRALFPRGFELIFDNYDALVFGFAPSEKTSESFLSIAAYPRWVTLFFLNGATLSDPDSFFKALEPRYEASGSLRPQTSIRPASGSSLRGHRRPSLLR